MVIKNCFCKPEPEDDKLHILIKSMHRGKVYSGVLEIEGHNKNEKYVKDQCRKLADSAVRGLIKHGHIIPE